MLAATIQIIACERRHSTFLITSPPKLADEAPDHFRCPRLSDVALPNLAPAPLQTPNASGLKHGAEQALKQSRRPILAPFRDLVCLTLPIRDYVSMAEVNNIEVGFVDFSTLFEHILCSVPICGGMGATAHHPHTHPRPFQLDDVSPVLLKITQLANPG